jgi:hypothetical protein
VVAKNHGVFCDGTLREAVPEVFSEERKPERSSGTFFFHCNGFRSLCVFFYTTCLASKKTGLFYRVPERKTNPPPLFDRILGHFMRFGTYFFSKITLQSTRTVWKHQLNQTYETSTHCVNFQWAVTCSCKEIKLRLINKGCIYVRFYVLAAASMKIRDFWDVALCTHLWNVGLLQWDYTALYPRRHSSSKEVNNFYKI